MDEELVALLLGGVDRAIDGEGWQHIHAAEVQRTAQQMIQQATDGLALFGRIRMRRAVKKSMPQQGKPSPPPDICQVPSLPQSAYCLGQGGLVLAEMSINQSCG